jgi:hypothetical protein
MPQKIPKIVLLVSEVAVAATGVARADCESDLIQLQAAYRTQNLPVDAKAALDRSLKKAVAALLRDDDKTCHSVIAEAFAKAGMTLK